MLLYIAKNFLVHIENPTRRENKSQGVLHSKKVAFVFIDSFLSIHVKISRHAIWYLNIMLKNGAEYFECRFENLINSSFPPSKTKKKRVKKSSFRNLPFCREKLRKTSQTERGKTREVLHEPCDFWDGDACA